MAKLSLKIIRNRRNAAGKINIYVSLTFKNEVRFIPSGFAVDDEAEFESGEVCFRRDAAIMNKRLNFILNSYQEKLKRLDELKFSSCSQLKDALTKVEKPENLSISELFERRVLDLEKQGRKSYAKMNRYTSNVVVSILGNPPIDYLTH